MIIDFSAHFLSARVVKILAETSKYYGPGSQFGFPTYVSLEDRLEMMKKYKTDMQVLSLTSPSLLGYQAEEAAKISKLTNDDISALCDKYPEKFAGLAAISLLDVGSAIEELDRAVGNLGLRGVILATNQNGKGLDSHEYGPFYEKLVKYDVPIFLHPTNWSSYPLVDVKTGWRMLFVFGRPFDTTQAIHRLIFSGTMEKYPSLKFVAHHLGGMLPFFGRRLEVNLPTIPVKLPRPLPEYLDKVYGDTAVDGSVPAVGCGYAYFGPNRIVFGTDYPMGPEKGEIFARDNLNAVEKLKISDTQKNKIFEKNARKLLKL